MKRPGVLSNPNFRRFFIGQSVSLLGDQAAVLAIPLTAILLLHVNAFEVGMLTAAGIVPSLLFSLPFGALIDSQGRRRQTMLVADLVRALAVLSVPVTYFLGHLSITQLFAVAFTLGTLDVAFFVAYQALLVAVVSESEYMQANTLLNGSRAASQVVGLSVGGTLVSALTAPGALILDAVSFGVSGYQLARIHPEEPPGAPKRGSAIRDGIRWVAQHGAIRSLLLSAAIMNLFAFVGNALLVLYASRTLGLNAAVIGLTFAAGAIGGLIGAASCGAVQRRFGLGPFVVASSMAFAVSLLLYPAAGGGEALSAIVLGTGEFLAAIAVLWLDISLGVIFAQEVPDDFRSRVAGSYRMVNYGVRPLGAILGGLLGVGIGIRAAMLISALGVIAGATVRIRQPILRLRRAGA